MEKDIIKKLNEYKNTLEDIGSKLNISEKENRLRELDAIINRPDFWTNVKNTKDILNESKSLRKIIDEYSSIKENIDTLIEMVSIDIDYVDSELDKLNSDIENLKISTLLNGEFDSSACYIEIHSGAGGTESNDWANMLYRMYTRYFEKNNYTYEEISRQDGEEVGIKGVTVLVKGYYPFGYLKGETGVHRLVRISPFDSNSRRHTSFASVLVTPQINKNLDVEINESDLRIDVYRSSGCGGQGVNTTDSAVRITHIPTGIVTSCQLERSQIQNKQRAMEMLKNKLYILKLNEFNEKLSELKGNVMDVNFGSAIRSYVMCPYTLVKDTRTNYETSNVNQVLDGDIEEFLLAYLRSC